MHIISQRKYYIPPPNADTLQKPHTISESLKKCSFAMLEAVHMPAKSMSHPSSCNGYYLISTSSYNSHEQQSHKMATK